MKNYLFLGDTNPKGEIAKEYCQFVLNVAAGHPIETPFIVEGRSFSSRGGIGTG